MLELQFLDHVAIKVKDLEASAKWYEEVLGLKKYQPEAWKPFPILLLAGHSGIALFPVGTSNQKLPKGNYQTMSHFAFRVTYANLEKAKHLFLAKNIPYDFQDHHYFHSVYISDPDGYRVELTAKVEKVVSDF